MGEDNPRGQPRPYLADLSSESGWVATDVAARAVRVSPRTIRRYIDQGRLEAKPQGEGVRREWLVSIDSLHALLASRTVEESSPRVVRADDVDNTAVYGADNIADVIRELAARLERRAEEAAELRVRLELTERTQSTLENERRQALEDLEEERRRREEAEQKNSQLLRELEALKAEPQAPSELRESPVSPGPDDTPQPPSGDAHGAAERPFTEEERPERSWWRRFFGF